MSPFIGETTYNIRFLQWEGNFEFKNLYIPMQNWLILTDHDIVRNEIAMTTKRDQFKFEKLDKVIVLRKRGENWRFTVYGEISNIKIPITKSLKGVWGKKTNLTVYLHKIKSYNLKNADTFSFDELKFSLKAYSKISAQIHKQNNYAIPISDFDFETILKGRIFMARTAFGRLATALPIESQFDFIKCILDNYKCYDLRVLGYRKALDALLRFIDARFECVGEEIIKANDLLTKVFGNSDIDLDEVGIYDERESKSRSIRKQSKLFSRLKSLEEELQILTQLDTYLKENEKTEEIFEKEFRNYSWPLNL